MLLNSKQLDDGGGTIGIDATNLRRGGGLTHLIELLRAADPHAHGVRRVVVWGGRKTLAELDDRPWLHKIHLLELDGGLLRRALWQRFSLSKAARAAGCSLLFIPGGSYAGDFRPVVTMSRNMLPFEMKELLRYGWSLTTIKLLLLRLAQSRSFRYVDGVIFLAEYARQGVLRVTGPLSAVMTIIPHGLNTRFQKPPKTQFPVSQYNHAKPFRFLYVSIIDVYKHQECVAQAVALLRARGLPIEIDFIGPAYPPALKRLEAVIRELDPNRRFLHYRGAVPFEDVHHAYANADAFVFASSCENLPNILIEAMAAGLAIACSRSGPMPETLGDAGLYFDPENVNEIATVLERLFSDDSLRATMARDAHARAKSYSWERAAQATFAFIHQVAESRVTL